MNTKFFKLTAALGLVTTVAVAEHAPVEVGGFVDVQANYKRKAASEGFYLNDSALYLTGNFTGGKVYLDLPISRDTVDGSFVFGRSKAQAYISLTGMDGLVETTLGQFDAIHRFEAADSIDTQFTTSGELASLGVIPTVHTGAMVALSPKVALGDVSVKALVANNNNKTTKSSQNFEYGAQVGFKNETFRASTGYVLFDNGAKNRHFADLIVGATYKNVDLDLEGIMLKDPSTSPGNGNVWGSAYLVHLVGNDVVAGVDLGLRGEMSRKMTSTAYRGYEVTFGPAYDLNDHVKLKADYTWERDQAAAGAAKTTTHTVAVAALAHF